MGFPAGHPDFPCNAEVGDKHRIYTYDYVFNGYEWVVEKLCFSKQPEGSGFQPYVSPASGEIITSERKRRYDMESNGCVDARDLTGLPREGMDRKKKGKLA